MSTKLALAAAALVAVLAGPTLAYGRPSAAHARVMRQVPANAHASVATARAPRSSLYGNDFQLQGRP